MQTLLDAVIEVPHAHGLTSCHVLVTCGHPPARPVVQITELADNEGPSISMVYELLAARVRELVHLDVEPVWLERWSSRAVASALLHDEPTSSWHLREETPVGWRRVPLNRAATQRLLAP
ncbi:MAG: hypothetical protein M3P04_13365 [Actinomycetota bacterium]|nr:hypothetical protein [Actinomycetota bacterium]